MSFPGELVVTGQAKLLMMAMAMAKANW